MRHSNSGRKFSRTPAHRKAMFMNLAKVLIMHGRIRTTEMKAKDLRRVVEPLVSLAKRNSLHARRLAFKELNDHRIVKHLFDNIGPLFAERPGGYTRVLKLAQRRKGDNAPMAVIEFTAVSPAEARDSAKESEQAEPPVEEHAKEGAEA